MSEDVTAVERQERRLRRLHDALAGTGMAGRYWMSFGLLLGFAREGGILPHDTLDADFVYLRGDESHLNDSFPVLAQAGFTAAKRYPNVSAPGANQWAFTCEDAQFDFFAADLLGDRLETFTYGGHVAAGPTENRCDIPAQPLEDVAFIGRRWLKPVDHDLELTALYGGWRLPDPSYEYMRSPAIAQRRPWDLTPGFDLV